MYILTIPDIDQDRAKANLQKFQTEMKGCKVTLSFHPPTQTAIYNIDFAEALKGYEKLPFIAKLLKSMAHKAEQKIRVKYPRCTMEYVRD